MSTETPSKILLSLEVIRGLYEYGLAHLLSTPLNYVCPRGDGHPVIVFPGLGTSDSSTRYLRTFLDNLGYVTYPWGLGRNLGPRKGLEPLIKNLSDRLEFISNEHQGQPVSIIGWSLGGVYGREIAKIQPNKVRQVITLGTPFKIESAGTNATFLYELLSKDTSYKDPEILKKIGIAPPVPFTSLYSKTDGVVHWKCSLESITNIAENIEIRGASHLGIGHNPISMYIIANRLKHTKETWQPFRF